MAYAAAFWRNWSKIENGQKQIERIEKGELEIEKRRQVDLAIELKFKALIKAKKKYNQKKASSASIIPKTDQSSSTAKESDI
jgi:hypothetical protein